MTQSDQFDSVPFGPPPATNTEMAGFGAAGTTAGAVRIMLKGSRTLVDPNDGKDVAYVECSVSSATQAIQALRQAIGDARLIGRRL